MRDLKFDKENPNAGTQRGDYVLELSVEKTGINRSIVVDKNGVIVAGNKTIGKLGERGLDDADVVVVKTKGDKLVVVQREDWDLYNDTQARLYSYLDNHAALVGIELSGLHIEKHEEQGISFSEFLYPEELAKALGIDISEEKEGSGEESNNSDHASECPNCGYIIG